MSFPPSSNPGATASDSTAPLTISGHTWRVLSRDVKKSFLSRKTTTTLTIGVDLTPLPGIFRVDEYSLASPYPTLYGELGPTGIIAARSPSKHLVGPEGTPIDTCRIAEGSLVLFDGVDIHAVISPADTERFFAWLHSSFRAHTTFPQ